MTPSVLLYLRALVFYTGVLTTLCVFAPLALIIRPLPYRTHLDAEVLPDVACVALNRMGSRYIRHAVDLSFNMIAKQRTAVEENLHDAVTYAFELVQTRIAMQARR